MPTRACIAVPGRAQDAYFFSGGKYAHINWTAGKNDDILIEGPANIITNWPSLRLAGFNTVDAVLQSPEGGGVVYFFRGSKYAKVKIDPSTTYDTTIFGPANIADHWPSLVTAQFDIVDTVFQSPVSNEFYFFCGTRFVKIRLAIHASTLEDSILFGPADIVAHWQTLKSAGFDTVDTALPDPMDSKVVYVFSGPKFVKIRLSSGANILDFSDHFGPADVATYWSSLVNARFY